jgi:hypothetical protein
MGRDDPIECATDEGEGDEIARRTERVVSKDIKTAEVD